LLAQNCLGEDVFTTENRFESLANPLLCESSQAQSDLLVMSMRLQSDH